MTDTEAKTAVPPETAAAVQEQVFQSVGFDVPRHWASQAQTFRMDGTVLIVFREQMQLVGVANPGELPLQHMTANIARNVTSVVLPLKMASELGSILIAMASDQSDKSPTE